MRFNSYLPFIILLVFFFVNLFVSINNPTHFEYDESVVYEISKLPVSDLIDTVQAEPHPFGFYILVKVLAGFGKNNLRLLLTFLGTLLTFASLVIAHKNNLLGKYKFTLGISLFLGTSGFMGILATLKQDVVSFPLLLIVFFLALSVILNKRLSVPALICIHLSVTLVLAFGYIAYLEAMLLLLIFTLYFKEKPLTKLLSGFQILIFSIYLIFYGGNQLILNLQRFVWLGEFQNSFIKSTSNFLVGLDPSYVWTDIVLFIFFIFIFKAFSNLSKIERKEVSFGVVGIFFNNFIGSIP